ncbi:uncharacterized protein LDX57_007173 [Aspergillus melleus]|uniref:uncharacterized protein n=1 Tax=Aspergillus melleus TaxID=138277 RepID=UPI001E8D4AE0|nr:uncharacterized protein LDX57_007173 [Aspergillus melleus]KAH8429511.1 hypothetical protein LDX57_007173 [Aspergillus melleus]
MSGDTLKGIYGMNEDVILYWAHHEKLCLIDGRTAFMGGLDMCFGRWDTNQHALTDVHPENLNEIVFPGQDYNNARVLDFQDVPNWEKNQLDRKNASRMGWSDVSVSLHGHVVEDLRRHFVERWNFIYDSKYEIRKDSRYSRLALYGRPSSSTSQRPHSAQQQGQQQQHQQQQPPPQQQQQQPTQPQYQQQRPAQNQPSAQQTGIQQSVSPQPGGGLSMVPPAPPMSSKPNSSSYQPSPAQSPSPGAPPPYTYTGDSFPPPPPGPPPSQGQSQTQTTSQSQSQTPYFPPPPSQAGQSQTQVQAQSPSQSQSSYYAPPPHGAQELPTQTRGVHDYYEGTRGHGDHERGFAPQRFREEITQYGNVLRGQLAGQIHQYQDRFGSSFAGPNTQPRGNMCCQIVRSCSKWSNGTPTEHSIADAYAAIIRNSEHFVYIENQFFITATGDSQKPVQNKIGAAIVERILRAAKSGQKYKVIVVIPSVPCFAGDLSDDSTLGTRAIMEFQYNSINRGGNSIMELIAQEGHNPMDYIRFYNLRNYDRINLSGPLAQAEQRSGVNYEDARKQHDVTVAGQGGYGPGAPRAAFDTSAPFQQYQQAARDVGVAKSGSGRWDSVSECYMLHGPDLRNVPWDGPAEAEIDAFVTEELYVHSKVCIIPYHCSTVRLTSTGHDC